MGLQKKKILILCGERSSEREVSLMSGKNVFKNLSRRKYDATLVEIDKKGEWIVRDTSRPARIVVRLPRFARNDRRGLDPCLRRDDIISGFDVVFIALHGSDGENGEIQKFLESAGVRYTCSGVEASKIAIDKYRTSKAVEKVGVISPKTIVLHRGDKVDDKAIKSNIGYPCVVKPNSGGSSVATSIVHNRKELRRSITTAFKEDTIVLVQQLIHGRELTCPVLGNFGQKLSPLPVLEIKHSEQFFDYNAKYESNKTREEAPSDIDDKIIHEVRRQSVAVHRVLGCNGITRSDFILSEDGGLYFLEINTVPGMTKASLCPKSAKIAGIGFGELLDKIIQLSLTVEV